MANTGMKGMRGMAGMKPLKEMEPLQDLNEVVRQEEERLKGWARAVGVDRAQEVLQLARQRPQNRTLPELLAEVWLRKRSVRYEAQFDLGWARPDFVLFEVSAAAGGCMVWEINGEYWHKNTAAHDTARKERLLSTTARGLPIVKVVEVWEKDIYQSEAAFEQALAGINLRGG
jgi:hypothetical protein